MLVTYLKVDYTYDWNFVPKEESGLIINSRVETVVFPHRLSPHSSN